MKTKSRTKLITINNPDRWGLAYGKKRRQFYYKLEFSFFSDPQISTLSSDAKIVFLDIIKESIRANTHSVYYCLRHGKNLIRDFNGNLDTIKGLLRELEINNIINLTQNVRRQYIEENRIEENRIEENSNKFEDFGVDKNENISQEMVFDYNQQFKKSLTTSTHSGVYKKLLDSRAMTQEQIRLSHRYVAEKVFNGSWTTVHNPINLFGRKDSIQKRLSEIDGWEGEDFKIGDDLQKKLEEAGL